MALADQAVSPGIFPAVDAASLEAVRAEVEQARVLTIRAEQICAEQELQHAAEFTAFFWDYHFFLK